MKGREQMDGKEKKDRDESREEIKRILEELRAAQSPMYQAIVENCERYLDWYSSTCEREDYEPADDRLILVMDGLTFEIPLLSIDILSIVDTAVQDIRAFAQGEMDGPSK